MLANSAHVYSLMNQAKLTALSVNLADQSAGRLSAYQKTSARPVAFIPLPPND